MGGTRHVPLPDAVAREFLLLALRLDQHAPGTVDGYFGPADIKAQVDLEPLRAPARLAEDARRLREGLPGGVAEPDRRHWLDLQVAALETLARVQAGEAVPYLEQVGSAFAWAPQARPPERFEVAARILEGLLPGSGPLTARLAAEDEAWTVPPERVRPVVDVLLARFRERARALFGLPEGEDLRVGFVRGQPWTGYNWYDGGYRSRVDLNLDLPLRLPGLVGVVAHEAYPGHHLEHALREQELVERLGRLEASVLLINTPECLVSEGLANVGRDVVVPPADLPDLLEELAGPAGLALAKDAAALREAAGRHVAAAAARAVLDEARVNAALMLHHEGRPRSEVLAFLVEVGRFRPDVAAKRLEFIEHPLWRTYVFVYPEGEALLRRWLEAVDPSARAARFGRLLREPLTPPTILAELEGRPSPAGPPGPPAAPMGQGAAR